ncbi:PilZ domain-containing protein [Pseudomarimonas salicorniae]|uniref:PilZ domain-containing protein n=1 Tax=Pseudomarimonas salicorniae TaxID=2933270 RepID=A0ABT0GLW5_9GAMM|nr:PilZ domain-containing protein [Lysobacter sp. CAU 1642]MCK7595536.1 PilZ domain-containing protein [Lysobacter sp. CAU 1642]
MNEFRRAKRRQLSEVVQVVDSMTDEVMGRMGNLSETGMLLFSRSEGVDDALFQLNFSLRLPKGGSHEFSVGAHQLWSEASPSSGTFWNGFRFIDLAPDDLDMLRTFVNQPGGAFA